MSWYGSFAIPTEVSSVDTGESSAIPASNESALVGSRSPAIPTNDVLPFGGSESSAMLTNVLTTFDTNISSNANNDMSPKDRNDTPGILTSNTFSFKTSDFSASFTDLVSWFDAYVYTNQDAETLIRNLETQIARWDKETQDELNMPSPPTPGPCMICDTIHYYKNNCTNLKHATALCRSCWTRNITNELSLGLDPCFCPLTFCRARIPADEITKALLSQQRRLEAAWRAKVFKKYHRGIRAWPEKQHRMMEKIERMLEREREVLPMDRLRVQHHKAQKRVRAPVPSAEEAGEEGRKNGE